MIGKPMFANSELIRTPTSDCLITVMGGTLLLKTEQLESKTTNR